jgi:hypothetical protein
VARRQPARRRPARAGGQRAAAQRLTAWRASPCGHAGLTATRPSASTSSEVIVRPSS